MSSEVDLPGEISDSITSLLASAYDDGWNSRSGSRDTRNYESALRHAIGALVRDRDANAKDAARWRMLPAFIQEHQIDYVRLVRQIDDENEGRCACGAANMTATQPIPEIDPALIALAPETAHLAIEALFDSISNSDKNTVVNAQRAILTIIGALVRERDELRDASSRYDTSADLTRTSSRNYTNAT